MNVRGALSANAFLLTILIGACSRSPAEQAEKQVATLHSWTAAAAMAVDAWSAGGVPSAYAARTLEVGGKELRQAASSLEELLRELPPGSAPAAAAAQAAISGRQAGRHLDAARLGIERGDRAAAGAAAHLLAADAAVLSAADSSLEATSP